jgi:hypothetical protein
VGVKGWPYACPLKHTRAAGRRDGFAFDGYNRLETGIDGFLELRDPQTGQTLARWIGAQDKTTNAGSIGEKRECVFVLMVRMPNHRHMKLRKSNTLSTIFGFC